MMTMDTKPIIRTEADLDAALKEIDELINLPNSPDYEHEYDRLEVLSILVADYEDEHYHLSAPDPAEAIKYDMEKRGVPHHEVEDFWAQVEAQIEEKVEAHKE